MPALLSPTPSVHDVAPHGRISAAAHWRRPSEESEDRDLLLRSGAEDTVAFEALFKRHRDGLQGFLYRKLGSVEEAEDALSLTFSNAWRARGSFRGHSSGKSWLYRIATHVALDMLRRRCRRVTEEELTPAKVERTGVGESPTPEPLTALLDAEWEAQTERVVHQAIARLNSEQRRLVRLFYFDGRSHEEIGGIVGLSASKVKGRLHLIRERLRRDTSVRELLAQPA
jgi:RNA polymerase sigma-70 factor (ECF subfamily)